MSQTNKLIIVLFTIISIQDCRSILWPCEVDGDCTAIDSRCSNQTGSCECKDFDSVFSEDYTKCLKTSQIGDSCEYSVQCNLMPSGANCKSGVCDCADGHTYVRGRCRLLKALGQTCESDLECYFGYDRDSVTCRDRVCQCANGYYRRHGNICRRKSMDIGDACVVNTDCDDIGTNVECKNLTCQFVDEIPSTSNSPSTVTDTPSNETGTPTTLTDIPTTETLSPNDDSVYTKKGQTSQGTSSLVNGANDSTDDNNEELQSKIKDKKYTKQSQHTQTSDDRDRKQSREIAVQTSIDAFELKDLVKKTKNVATTTNSTSTSSRHTYHKRRQQTPYRFNDDDIKTFSTLSNTDDDGDDRNYGSSCTENGKSCSGLPHSICSNNICFCKQGYYHKRGKCFAELGEIAESADECEFTFQEPLKKCICQKNYFYDRNLRVCRKPIQYHLSCTANNQCSPFGAAYCHPEIPRRCTCEDFAEYDAYQQMCVFKQGLGAECDTNEGCPVDNSLCMNRRCVCKEKYFEKDGACLPGLGADCVDDTECKANNSVCETKTSHTSDDEQKEKSCQCRKGFVHFKDECLKEADEIEEECIESEQCKPLLASCIQNSCQCNEQQQIKNGRCENKKDLGESCSRATECFVEKDVENVECRNSVCQCKFGYQADSEKKTCIRMVPNKKNSSGRPSALKIITFVLIGSAFLITSAAIRQAYFY